ncbi:MAG: PKD domain-containing protein [Cyclobacteriaceae bacterium]|nr:PKD domain-containing protein [Cyclobacteriaceae bacterium]
MKQGVIVVILIMLHSGFSSYAQVIDFDIPPNACSQERLQLENTSVGVIDNYLWDFCEGDLTRSVTATLTRRLNTIDQVAGIESVKQGGNYFSMLIDRATGVLYRLSFGNSLTNAPTVTTVTIPPEIAVLSPQGFKLVQVGNQWFGFLVSTGNNKIYRLDFGGDLTNSPSVSELNFMGALNAPIELELAKDGSDYFILAVNFSGNNLVIAKLGEAITNQPETVSLTPVPGASNPYGFSLKQFKDGVWRGVVGSFSNGGFHTVSFENGIGQPPVISSITSLLPVIVNPVKLALETWGEESVLLVITSTGSVNRIHFSRGSVMSSVQSADVLGNFGQSLALSLFYDNGSWQGFTFSSSTRDLRILYFDSTCSEVSMGSFSGAEPPVIQYFTSGLKDVSLISRIDGILVRKTKSISINALLAPAIDFLNDGICISSPVNFSASSDQALSGFDWSFGDLGTSSLAAPSHQYDAIGAYDVKLTVMSNNGCSNFRTRQVKIYPSPVASFQIPTGIICTNNEYSIVNTTNDVFDGNLSYTWLINDELISTDRNLNHAFSTSGDQQIKLIIDIPGCSSESVQIVNNVLEGPEVNFSFSGQCENVPVTFTNLTIGEATSFHWDFDDGQVSTGLNAEHIFSNPGQFTVSLSATTASGCLNKQKHIVNIYSQPQADFSLALPPFSCSGSASQFTDLTPQPVDSNITSWNWTFGDAENNTATLRNPTHVYAQAGEYSVKLMATTNFGCTGEVTKAVTIAATPVVDFTNTPMCLNQPATFTPTNASEIKSWLWSMPNAAYTIQNPVHVFTNTGNQAVILTATGHNNCVRTVSKNLTVPVPVAVNFSATSTCAGKPAVFTETTIEGTDPAVSWNWDFAGQATATTSTASHIFPSMGSFNVHLNSTRQSGCTYSSTRNIAIGQAPVARFSASTESGGAPLTVGFTNLSSGATSYLWKFNDSAQTTSTETSPLFTYTQLGTYQAELIATNSLGCADSYVKDIFVVVPLINAAVTNLLLLSNNDGIQATVTFENRGNVVLVNPEIILDLAGKAKIRERATGTFLPGQQGVKSISTRVMPDNIGYLCAEIFVVGDGNSFDNRACSNLTQELTVVPPYPNPADTEVIFEWIRGQRNEAEVRLYNAQGQVVLSKTYTNLSAGLNQLRVDVKALLPGLYFTAISDGDKSVSHRLLVNR